jgi:hypothetical protein
MTDGVNGNKIPDDAFDLKAIKKPIPIKALKMSTDFFVDTPEGRVQGKAGDYLLIGIKGERYPCRKDIFEESYDIVRQLKKDGLHFIHH